MRTARLSPAAGGGGTLFRRFQMDGEPDGRICRIGDAVRHARRNQQPFTGTKPTRAETLQFRFRLAASNAGPSNSVYAVDVA